MNSRQHRIGNRPKTASEVLEEIWFGKTARSSRSRGWRRMFNDEKNQRKMHNIWNKLIGDVVSEPKGYSMGAAWNIVDDCLRKIVADKDPEDRLDADEDGTYLIDGEDIEWDEVEACAESNLHGEFWWAEEILRKDSRAKKMFQQILDLREPYGPDESHGLEYRFDEEELMESLQDLVISILAKRHPVFEGGGDYLEDYYADAWYDYNDDPYDV